MSHEVLQMQQPTKLRRPRASLSPLRGRNLTEPLNVPNQVRECHSMKDRLGVFYLLGVESKLMPGRACNSRKGKAELIKPETAIISQRQVRV